MRLLTIALGAVLLISAQPAAATNSKTVWNVMVPVRDGVQTRMSFLGENPNKFLSTCRCVAGIWKLASKGETATHFSGTIKAPAFNHPRAKAKTLQVKVRKTRALMGAAKDYRDTLHGIIRGSGQVVLREVSGGEWEVVGFAAEAVGNIFATHSTWRADPKDPPKAAQPSPIVDPTADAGDLAVLINDYRASLKLPRVPVSAAMTKVAQAHVHDLNVNKPVKEGCNMHSWSSKGSWTACCYDSSKEAARCMWSKPKQIAGYKGMGYEIAAGASGITPAQALDLWQKSEAHHAVMINKGIWKKPWRAMGVAVEGDFAVAWFGEEADK
ncbi:MAG TPA: CAP domain-containing protein [Kofleriaceae bacterium]